MHGDVRCLRPKVVGEMFSERLESRFAAIVGGIARRVGDALLTPRNDDRLVAFSFQHVAEEGRHSVDDAKNVGLVGLLKVGAVGPEVVGVGGFRLEGSTGVEHEEVDAGGERGFDFAFDGCPGVVVAYVEGVGLSCGGGVGEG